MRDAETSYTSTSWHQKLFKTSGNYYDVIKYIDTQFDPLRTLFNQFCRIFSGSISEALVGKLIANHYLFPVLYTLGLVSNFSNAVYKYMFFRQQKGWQAYWPYLALTLTVAWVSTAGLLSYIYHNFDTKWLVVYNLPLTIWCGSLQLLAECWNLLERFNEYKSAKSALIETLTEPGYTPTNAQVQKLLKTTRLKIKALRNKYIITWTLLSVMLISWSSNLGRTFFLNLGTEFSLSIACIGISISVINYYKDIILHNYLHPSEQTLIAQIKQDMNQHTKTAERENLHLLDTIAAINDKHS